MIKLLQGDCLIKLKELEDNSVDSIVTDPPYELGFMGKSWDNTGIANNPLMWAECLRVLKPGGYLLSFGGTRTYHRMASAIEDAGFEVRDMIEWVYGSGFPKSLNIGKSVNQLETNEWSKISKALDNIDQKSIIEIWKSNSNNVKIVETQSLKNQIIVGQDTLSENFVVLNVVQNSNQESLNLLVSFVEQNLNEVQAINTKINTALPSVEAEIRQLQDNVKSAEQQSQNQNHKSWSIFTAQCDVKEWLKENTMVNHKVDEAMKTLRGNKKYSNEEITSVLCAVIPSVLKLTILNQSKTFQNLDTNQKMECASATNVIITEYTAENLISNTVDILKSKAVDKLQGNKREDLGWHSAHINRPETENWNKSATKMNHGKFKVEGKQGGGLQHITKGTSEWEGWGTALKPSHESIMLAQKPLTSVPLFDKIDIDLIIKKILCLLVSNVKIAESNLVLSQHGLSEELNIAQWIAEENTNTQDALSVLTDMLLLESKINTNLNIVILWLNILEDLYQLKNKFTTLTEISLTIELKILESLEWENIFQNITQAKDKKTDGKNVNVLTAVNLFNAVRLKLNHILTHFAQDPAILKDEYSDIRPNHEPICMARKPLSEKTVAENCLKWGTGGINIDESRVEGIKEWGSGHINFAQKHAERNEQAEIDSLNRKEKENEGRFPANLCWSCDCDNNYLTGNALFDILSNISNQIKLCQLNNSNSNALNVEQKKHQQDTTNEEKKLCFAVENVDTLFLEKILGKTLEVIFSVDTECSVEMLEESMNTSLSISLSGNEKMEEYQKVLKYITLTAIKLITELKTCNLSQSQIIGNFITKVISGIREQSRVKSHSQDCWVRECFPESKSVKANNVQRKDCHNTAMSGRNYARFNEEEGYNDSGNASRFFKSIIYQAKSSKRDRTSNVTVVNSHPTVKSVALMGYLIKMVTLNGGVVLDPFMGSGSTGVACVNNDFSFIGIDMTAEYIEIAKARIAFAEKEKSNKLL